MTGTPQEGRSPAPAVTRAAAILRLLAARGPQALTEVSRALGLAKSSTLNLLLALEEADLVSRDGSTYALGRATVQLGGAYVRGFDIVREFALVCDGSPVLAPELVHLAVLQDADALYLARHDGDHPWRLSALVGDRFPASITAVGNALLAGLDDDQLRALHPGPESLQRWTQHSVGEVEALLAKLARVRERGWALDEGETNPGVVGLAVALPPRRPGDVPMAMGASLPAHQASDPARERMVAALLAARDRLCSPRALSFPQP